MHDEHGLVLIDSEMEEIRNVCRALDTAAIATSICDNPSAQPEDTNSVPPPPALRIAKFLAERAKVRNLDPEEIASLHVGHEREAVLLTTDLRKMLNEHDSLRRATVELHRALGALLAANTPTQLPGDDRRYGGCGVKLADMSTVASARAVWTHYAPAAR